MKNLKKKLGMNAMRILQERYLLRDRNGKMIETPEKLFRRVAGVITKAEKKNRKKWEEVFYEMMVEGEFLPNTPCLMNAGTRLNQLSACFVLDIDDSLDSIFDALSVTAKIHQTGGGTGFSFSKLRPRGAVIGSTNKVSSGPVSFMKIFDEMTETMKSGGLRRGANMGILRVDHPDIIEFVKMKEDPDFMKNFNVSVAVTDEFMKAVKKNGSYYLVNPYNGKKVSKVRARKVFDLIVKYAWKTGDPGLVFIDEVNRKNPTKHIGKIEATNPCGEVPMHPWESCNLGSVNIAKFVEGDLMKGNIDWDGLREVIRNGMRFLDNLLNVTTFPDPRIKKMSLANRRIGLGVMGFAEALIMMGIPYDSNEAVRVAKMISKFFEDESIKCSQELGKERGSFPNFKGSLWQKKGLKYMRNATTTVIAPTGTISIIAGCSSGIEPIFGVSYVRNVVGEKKLIESNIVFEEIAKKKGFYSASLQKRVAKTGSIQKISKIPKKIRRLFLTAHEIPYSWHIKMQAAFQKNVHNAVSKTINLPKNASRKDVYDAYIMAWESKCKGVTVYRYGSKPEQVLNVGTVVNVDSDFAGGCPGGICSKTTT